MPELLLPLCAQPPQVTPVCVVMVDLTGSTDLARTLPLPHYMALMTEFVQVMILSFEARGGTVLQHQGDAVLGYWPAERAHDACRTALEAHGRAARLGLAKVLGVRLRLRAGVALGNVIVGLVGGQPSAYGLPVNYARRLCDAARSGETLACACVGTRFDPMITAQPGEPLTLPGFGAGCHVNRLSLLDPPLSAAHPQTRMKVD